MPGDCHCKNRTANIRDSMKDTGGSLRMWQTAIILPLQVNDSHTESAKHNAKIAAQEFHPVFLHA